MIDNILTQEETEAIRIRSEFIRKWGTDTISLFEKSIMAGSTADLLCGTVLPVCSTYSNAIMAVLQNGWRMPTKALLRIVFEATAKVLWCLSEQDTDHSKSAVEERVCRWAKKSVQEEIKLRDRIAESASGSPKDENDRVLIRLKAMSGVSSRKSMPDFTTIMKQLSESSVQHLYVSLYAQFLNAVHLDCVSLGKMVKDDGRTPVPITDDSNEPIEYLAQCWVVDMYILFFAIRSHYGWDTDDIAKEFKAIPWSEYS